MMDYHAIVGGASVVGSLLASLKYIRDAVIGRIKPHAFTWAIWSLLAGLASAVAFIGGATVNGFVLALCGAINFGVFAVAWRLGTSQATKTDWGFFLAALAVIPIWLAVKEPLLAAILVSVINQMACVPTMRKAWSHPQEESLGVFAFYTVMSLFSVLSITPFTLVTALYPCVILGSNALIFFEVLMRRRLLRKGNRRIEHGI